MQNFVLGEINLRAEKALKYRKTKTLFCVSHPNSLLSGQRNIFMEGSSLIPHPRRVYVSSIQ